MTIATMSRFSLSAYEDLRDAGELNKLERKVFETVAIHGPMTREEIEAESGLRLSSVCGRVNAMLKKGVLVEVGEKKNPITGKLNGLLDLSLAENTGHALPLVVNSSIESQSHIAVDQGECAA